MMVMPRVKRYGVENDQLIENPKGKYVEYEDYALLEDFLKVMEKFLVKNYNYSCREVEKGE